MKVSEKKEKRTKAYNKLKNQISVLSRTVTKKDLPLVKQLEEISGKLSIA